MDSIAKNRNQIKVIVIVLKKLQFVLYLKRGKNRRKKERNKLRSRTNTEKHFPRNFKFLSIMHNSETRIIQNSEQYFPRNIPILFFLSLSLFLFQPESTSHKGKIAEFSTRLKKKDTSLCQVVPLFPERKKEKQMELTESVERRGGGGT